MKRLFSMMVAFVLLVLTTLAIIIPVHGEHEPWDCPDCDRTGNKGNYCGECGYPAPWIDPDAWKANGVTDEEKFAAFRTPSPTPTSTPVPAPRFIKQPQSVTAKEGSKVFLTAVVEGATEFTWQYLNPSIGQWVDMVDTNGVSGSKWSELSVVVSDIWSRYQYRLVARNESEQTISNLVTITTPATPTPMPIATPTPDPVEAKRAAFRKVGSYVTFGSYEQDNNSVNGQKRANG